MSLKNWSTTAASNTTAPPDGAPESSTKFKDWNDIMRQVMAKVRCLAAPITIASAATTDLGASDETFPTVSGVVTITSFGTVSAGIYKFVTFSGALTLTHNATSLILLGGVNRTTAAGDVALYLSLGGGNWKEYFYHQISGASTFQPLDAQLTTLAGITAQQATDLASLSTFMGTVLNDTSEGAALTTLRAPLTGLTSVGASYTATSANRGHLIAFSGGSWTLSLPDVTTLPLGFSLAVRNDGTVRCVVDPFGAQVIDDVATIDFRPGDAFFIVGDGTKWRTVGRQTHKILQVVHFDTGAVATGTTIIPLDDTIPQITEGDQYMSLAITPLSATSTLLIEVAYLATSSAAGAWMTGSLFRDATASSVGVTSTYNGAGGAGNAVAFSVKVAAASTAATTFNVRVGANVAGTTTFNGIGGLRYFGGVMASSIRITEIGA